MTRLFAITIVAAWAALVPVHEATASDVRVLDRFDDTPTYQQEEAKKRAEARRRSMEDK